MPEENRVIPLSSTVVLREAILLLWESHCVVELFRVEKRRWWSLLSVQKPSCRWAKGLADNDPMAVYLCILTTTIWATEPKQSATP